MFSHSDEIKRALQITFCLSLYTIACLLIYFLSSWAGLAIPYQVAVIVLILLTWPVAIAVNRYRKKRSGAGEHSSSRVTKTSEQAGPSSPVRVYDELTRGAEEAVRWLRETKLADKSADPVYKLAWFLIAGPPQSGKTSMLLSSGLDFQALPNQRRGELNLIRPTRDCEWRVTDSSINIDSAGRYQSEGPDGEEWSSLIETLKRVRRGRPLDGFVIAVDAARVLNQSAAQIEQEAKILRARLDDAIRRTQTRFPVYMVFTHVDSLEGFHDFFATFDAREKSQVWGATIRLEQSNNAHALFDVEFDDLYDALMRHRLVRLGASAAPHEQLRVFNFPLSFAESRKKLGLFVSALFRPNPFSENPLLRGFYFTSSTAGENSKTAQSIVAHASAATTANLVKPESNITQKVETTRIARPGYFTERLFKEVFLRDKDLAQSFLLNRRRPFPVRKVLAGLAAALLLLVSVGLGISYFSNRRMIAEARERGLRVEEINRADAGKDLSKKTGVDAAVELRAIEELRQVLVQLDDYDKNSPPLYLRFGLYSGFEVNRSLRVIYFDAIERRFYKPVVSALERDLRTITSAPGPDFQITPAGNAASGAPNATQATQPLNDLGRYYDLLKAYLMLSNVDKVEPSFLNNQLADYWRKASPRTELESLSGEQLKFFALQANGDDVSHNKADEQLVADARRKLQAYPASDRLFKQLVSAIDAKVPPVMLDGIVRNGGRGVLGSSYTVPGSFTVKGYQEHWVRAVETAGEEISKDDWVMGPEATTSQDQAADVGRLQSIYFREYTQQWQRFLRGVNVREFKTKAEAVEALRALSASDSPMELLMLEVKRNTDLSAASESGGVWGWIKRIFSSERERSAGSTEVEKEFGALFPFVSSEDKKTRVPISEYRATIDQLVRSLEVKSDDQLAQAAKALLTGKDEIGLQRAEQEVSRTLEPFKTAASRDVARVLTQPLGNLRAMLYGGGFEQIDKTWRDQLYPRAHALESGFPFTDSSSETPVTDLAKFLNPANGQLTSFFNERLANSFEESQGKLTLRESGAVKLSNSFVEFLNNTRQLREALFPGGGAQPDLSYEVKLLPVTGADARIEIDGTSVEARSGSTQSAKFTWPARSGTSGAKIVVLRGGQQSEVSFPGDWGLFRMFGAGRPSKVGDNQFQLSWNIGSTSVRATIQASSATNPFERRLFTQIRAPQAPNE
jgi:type VI secretion system protein ImpL